MPQVSVITAVFKGAITTWTDATPFPASQECRMGEWEWSVQGDGRTWIPLERRRGIRGIRFGRGRPGRAVAWPRNNRPVVGAIWGT